MRTFEQFPYNYEVHIAGYQGTDFARLPEPFFINEIVSEDAISKIISAEVKTPNEAVRLFGEIQKWCRENDSLSEYGCRITLEQLHRFYGFNASKRTNDAIPSQQWEYNHNAYITFADVHADGVWGKEVSDALVRERGYLALDYVARNGKQFTVLTLHFLTVEMALEEADFLRGVLENGGFQGELSVEDSLGVEVIGPPITRPVIIGKL